MYTDFLSVLKLWYCFIIVLEKYAFETLQNVLQSGALQGFLGPYERKQYWVPTIVDDMLPHLKNLFFLKTQWR